MPIYAVSSKKADIQTALNTYSVRLERDYSGVNIVMNSNQNYMGTLPNKSF
jgi:hypothetical protein